MARTDTLGNFLTDVADAIRTKTGSQATIQASDFDTEIENIPSAGGDINWSTIGYSASPQAVHNIYDYSKNIYDNWDADNPVKFTNNTNLQVMPLVDTSKMTNMQSMFSGCTNLTDVPNLDTTDNVTYREMFSRCSSLKEIDISGYSTSNMVVGVTGSFREMFSGCSNLVYINFGNFTKFDPSKTNSLSGMFTSCIKLDNDTLNQILKLCILIGPNISASDRKISVLGIDSYFDNYSNIPNLSNYQDFINAGWSLN